MSRACRRAHRMMWPYLKCFPNVTAEEIEALRLWVMDGNSPHENGSNAYDDSGSLMDFISAMRLENSMHQEWLEDPDGFAERYLSFKDKAGNDPTDYENPGDDNLPF